jgi:hypothetical protein
MFGDTPIGPGDNHSVWRTVLDGAIEPQISGLENQIIEYLRCHRHDLPPAVWIKPDRRYPRP